MLRFTPSMWTRTQAFSCFQARPWPSMSKASFDVKIVVVKRARSWYEQGARSWYETQGQIWSPLSASCRAPQCGRIRYCKLRHCRPILARCQEQLWVSVHCSTLPWQHIYQSSFSSHPSSTLTMQCLCNSTQETRRIFRPFLLCP